MQMKGYGAKKNEFGKTFYLFVLWVAQRLFLQEACVVHENVPQFKYKLFKLWLGKYYHIESLVVCPSELGWPVQRERLIPILIHKRVVAPLMSWLSFRNLSRRSTSLTWTAFMIASQPELDAELNWGMSRPNAWRNLESSVREALGDYNKLASLVATSVHASCLTVWELRDLSGYLEWASECVVMLNQDNEEHGQTSNANTGFPQH